MIAEYEAWITVAANSLAEGELWCVYHPDGPLEMTASKRMDAPIIVVCEALKRDWDDLQEQGFYLGTIAATDVPGSAA